MIHAVRIELTGPGRGTVWLDGHELSGVVDLDLIAGVNEPNRLYLTICPHKMSVDAQAVRVILGRRLPRPRYAPSYFDYMATRGRA